MSKHFDKGQTVFDRDGRAYEFAGMMGSTAIVHPMYEGQGWEGEAEVYPSELAQPMNPLALSAKPPVQSVNAELAKAQTDLSDILAKISEAEKHLREAEKGNNERLTKLKHYSALSRVEDFIEGRMTHFVCRKQYGRGVEVETFEAVMNSKDDRGRYDGDIKLLSLFGTKKYSPQHGNKGGDLLWKVNHYYDGSGLWSIVQPCLSEEEAVSVASTWLDAIWEEHRALSDKESRAHWLKDAITSAEKLGLTVPDDIRKDYSDCVARAAQRAVEKAQDELDKALKAKGEVA